MDKTLKDRWIAALRSGKYQQGVGALRHPVFGTYQFCCLGILANLIDPDGWEGDCEWQGQSFFLPDKHLPRPVQTKLSKMNDGLLYTGDHKYDFSKIADWIAENIEEDE